MKKYRLVIFDLDGTIADTSEGVINCVKYVEDKMKLKRLNEDAYRNFIGPPNRESYNRYYELTGELLDSAVEYHKSYAMEKGIFEAKLYAWINELLLFLKSVGTYTAVATLKQYESARRMLQCFGLYGYFDIIAGDSGKNECKCDLINCCLKKTGIAKENAVVIGDSRYDQIGAAEAGVDFIGVTYGFGFHAAEDAAGLPCISVATDAEQLYKLLKGGIM